MNRTVFVPLIVFVFCVRFSYAQVLRRDTLPIFEVFQNRHPSSNPGLAQYHFDSKDIRYTGSFSLGELLSQSGNMFIRMNSNGSLASPSLRGMGAAHTALIWNGFNIQSSMNGQSDLNLVSPILFDRFTLQPGAGSALWGSSAAGGTLHLSSNDSISSLQIGQQNGSWNNRTTFIRSSLVKKRITVSLRAFHQDFANNYQYRNTALPGLPLTIQQHAGISQTAISGNVNISLGKQQLLKASVWHQHSNRDIPPLVTTPMAFAHQFDYFIRASVLWKAQAGRGEIYVRSGYFSEKIHFNDSLSGLYAQNNAYSLVQEAEWKSPFNNGRHWLQAGINHTFNTANVDGYQVALRTQQRAALFTSIQSFWLNKRLVSLLSFRQEWFDGTFAPLTPSLSASWALNSSLKLRSQVAGIFRIPTLNDLYWIPGGNPELKPERGHSAELSLEYVTRFSKSTISWSGEVFQNQINNRILWIPGASYWAPENIKQARSMGLGTSLKYAYQNGSNRWVVSLNAQHVLAGEITDTDKWYSLPEHQLIYTPAWLAAGHIEYSRASLTVFVQSNYTGIRYTLSDNTQRLPGYFLADAGIRINIKTGNFSNQLFFSCRNLLNSTYEVVAWRPMPLRSWHAGIQFFISKQTS